MSPVEKGHDGPAPATAVYVVADRTQVSHEGVLYEAGQTVELPDTPETSALLASGIITPAPAKAARKR